MKLGTLLQNKANLIKSGTVTINFGTGSLWRDFPIPWGTDTRSSAYKYLEYWLGDIRKLWPATTINLVVDKTEKVPEIDTSQHSAGQEILDDLARIALEVHNRHDAWIVRRNTDESRLYWQRYPAEGGEVDPNTPDDSGSETSDQT